VIKNEWTESAMRLLQGVQQQLPPGSPSGLPMSVPKGSCPALLELGDTIGEGAVGTVLAASSIASMSKDFAVKMVRKDTATVKGELQDTHVTEQTIMWEVHVLQELGRHAHIVRVMDVVDLVDATYIVMSRVNGPELTTYLAACPGGRLEAPAATRIFSQLLLALDYAHAKGFLHCDVKPQNVRLNPACDHAVLTDWGYAERVGSMATLCKGTPAYAPPEQLTGYCCDTITGRRQFTPAVDVWSLGVTLFQLLSGELPFKGATFEELIRNVLQLNYRMPPQLPPEMAELVDSMLQVSPCDRASTKEMLASPAVRGSGVLPAHDALCAPCEAEPSLHAGARWMLLAGCLSAMVLAAQVMGGDAEEFELLAGEPGGQAGGRVS